jgi:hypothetical protein
MMLDGESLWNRGESDLITDRTRSVHDGETVMTKHEGWYKSAMPSQKTDGGD